MDAVLTRIEAGVGYAVLSNPAKRNALSLRMIGQLGDALQRFAEDEGVRVVVIQGGDPAAFCSGGDISGFGDAVEMAQVRREYEQAERRVFGNVRDFAKPTVAAIRGYCLGGGLLLAFLCDVRLAAANATFALPPAKLGLGYSYFAVEHLVRLVGPARARHILYTGRRFDGLQAVTLGVVEHAEPEEMFDAFVAGYLAEVAGNAPLTIRAAKLAVSAALIPAEARDMDAVQRAIDACMSSEDFAEGQRAFKERRRPAFRGR